MTRTSWLPLIRRELRGARRVAVLGVGNPDRGDDAAGLACVKALRKIGPRRPSRLRLIEAGPVPENFTGRVRSFAPSHVILIDAARAGHKPGTVFPVDPDRIAHEDVSSHRTPLSWLARYLAETMGCRVLVVGIQPGRTEPGGPLSAAVRGGVERVAAGLAGILKTVLSPARERRVARPGERSRPVRSSWA